MAYNKHVWSVGEGIPSARLNNMEDEIDAIADADYTFGGYKTFAQALTMKYYAYVEGSTPSIRLNDTTPTSGVHIIIESNEGKLKVYKSGGSVFIADLITHAHSGGVGCPKIDWSDVLNRFHAVDHLIGGTDPLSVGVPSNIGITNQEGSLTNHVRRDHVHAHPSGLGVDLHHAQIHGPSDHTDRAHSIFVPGMAIRPGYQIGGTLDGIYGPELRNATESDYANASMRIPSGQMFKASNNRPVFLHIQNDGTNSGNIVINIAIKGMNDGDTSSTSLMYLTNQVSPSFSERQFRRWQITASLDLSTLYDIIMIDVLREASHVSDTLSDSVILGGVEIIPETDQ